MDNSERERETEQTETSVDYLTWERGSRNGIPQKTKIQFVNTLKIIIFADANQ